MKVFFCSLPMVYTSLSQTQLISCDNRVLVENIVSGKYRSCKNPLKTCPFYREYTLEDPVILQTLTTTNTLPTQPDNIQTTQTL